MFTRNTMLSLLALPLLAAGCDPEAVDPLAPQQGVAEASWVDGQKMVPVNWTFAVWAVAAPSVPCLLPDGSTMTDVPPMYAISGHFTHLGQLDEDASSATIHTCEVVMGQVGPEGLTAALTAHLVGPQEDAVDLEGTLTLNFAAGHAIGDWDIVGGAGRFEGAGGYLDSVEEPAGDGSGSVGSGAGTITLPQPMMGGRDPGR